MLGSSSRVDVAAIEVELIRGRERILSLHPLLLQIAALSGEPHDGEDLAYFLSTSPAINKTPILLLLRAAPMEPAAMGFSAAVLLLEYHLPFGLNRIFGGSGVFCSADQIGRRTVFGSRLARAGVAVRAARYMLRSGVAHIVHIAFNQLPRDPSPGTQIEAALEDTRSKSPVALWTLAERNIPLYLPLEPTFDRTVARIGQRTRSNLRYYRRRTERDLGCTYIPEAQVTLKDFLTFNRECMYTVSDEIATWRYHSLTTVNHSLFAGIQDRNGRWLALVGGRRRVREVEIDWQMNRDGLSLYSLSTVLRACLIEHEISQGRTRLYIEGGTPQPISYSFIEETVGEFTVRRRSLYAALLNRFSKQLFPEKTYVAQILQDKTQTWHSW